MGTVRPSPRLRVILLVEDEELVRILGVDYLQDAGFAVIEAADVAHAIVVIDEAARIDLVFTDVHMPGAMDGHALAAWLEQHWPAIPVLLTSGIDRPIIGSTGNHRRFIQKPYALKDVERHIRELLH
jgi:CheY-like chemotaxis protein